MIRMYSIVSSTYKYNPEYILCQEQKLKKYDFSAVLLTIQAC